MDVKLDKSDIHVDVLEVKKAAKKLVDLIGADVVVSVGRGISKDVEGGIKLAEGDYVIGAARARKDAYVLSITENGYGKRTPVEEFTVHHRGGGGMMLHNLTEKTGLVAGIAVVDSENDVMIITDDGVIIRTGVEEIRECGRGSQGVIVMRTGEDVKVISIARTDKERKTRQKPRKKPLNPLKTQSPPKQLKNKQQKTSPFGLVFLCLKTENRL